MHSLIYEWLHLLESYMESSRFYDKDVSFMSIVHTDSASNKGEYNSVVGFLPPVKGKCMYWTYV